MVKVTYNGETAQNIPQKMAQMQINLPIQDLVQYFVQTVVQFRLQNTVQFSMQNNLQKSVQSSMQIVAQKKWHRCKSVADFGTDVRRSRVVNNNKSAQGLLLCHFDTIIAL